MNEKPTKIIRHLSSDNYLKLPRATCQDVRLGWRSLGMLVYMLSLPADWEFYLSDLSNRRGGHGNGRAAARAALDELRDLGYLKIERVRVDGRITGCDWHISDLPIFRNGGDGPGYDFQTEEIQADENRCLQSKHVDKVNKEAAATAAASSAAASESQMQKAPGQDKNHLTPRGFDMLGGVQCWRSEPADLKTVSDLIDEHGIEKIEAVAADLTQKNGKPPLPSQVVDVLAGESKRAGRRASTQPPDLPPLDRAAARQRLAAAKAQLRPVA